MNTYGGVYGRMHDNRDAEPIDLLAEKRTKEGAHLAAPQPPADAALDLLATHDRAEAERFVATGSEDVEAMKAHGTGQASSMDRLADDIFGEALRGGLDPVIAMKVRQGRSLSPEENAAFARYLHETRNVVPPPWSPPAVIVPATNRPSWDATWMAVADLMAKRATCPRLSVGSVAVRDNQLLATAYNGAPRSLPHCIDVGCDMRGGHCVRAVHAEQNIIAQAAYRGVSLRGATLYTRHGFCVRCANLLIQSGIAKVVYVEEYTNGTDGALDALRSVGIDVWRMS